MSCCILIFKVLKFNGVLCGRATWSGAVQVYIEQGEDAAREWLRTTGFKNILYS
jgi:tagatose 1,6-diphosphate aldolase